MIDGYLDKDAVCWQDIVMLLLQLRASQKLTRELSFLTLQIRTHDDVHNLISEVFALSHSVYRYTIVQ